MSHPRCKKRVTSGPVSPAFGRRGSQGAFTLAIALGLGVSAGRVGAQDTQYWAASYGTQSRLLGGTVIGNDHDISSVYYNPGALGLEKDVQLLVSLNALQYSTLSFSSSQVQTKIPTNSSWSALPNMFAGAIRIGGKHSPQRLAYSLLTRQSYNFDPQIRALPLDSFAPPPPVPVSSSVGNVLASQSLSETWVGLTYATASGRHWGFGSSLFVTVRSQTFSQSQSAQAVNETGETAIGVREYDFSYYNWAVLLKAGVQYKDAGWSGGLTVTTPRLDLFGGSQVGATQSFSDQGVSTGSPISQVATDFQSQLSATYHSAFSVGAGIGHHWAGTDLGVSAEWFAAVPKFTIIPALPFAPQTGGAPISMALTAQYRSLFNWGVGARQQLSNHFDVFLAYRTDLTSIPPGERPVGTLINWDLRHVNVGVQGKIGPAALTLGFDTSWGSENNVNVVGTPAPGLPTVPTLNESYVNVVGAIAFSYAF
jgi:hypothetical protein